MPFTRPTLQALTDRITADINARIPGADARVRRSVLGVLARAHAAAAHGLYGYLDWLAQQIMPDTAELEHLDRWAGIWGVARRAAAAATGAVTFSGNEGAIIPAGTALQRNDGETYTTDALATISGGSASVAITADAAGAAANADTGLTLTLVTPIQAVNSAATVDAPGLSGGADTESDELLRDRLLSRIQAPPHGGAAQDYVAWALEVPAVTRAWVYPGEDGLGTVKVRFMMDDTYPDGIPQAGDVTTVQDHIDPLRPVTADVTVAAPVAVALDFTIDPEPGTADVKAAIEAELRDMLRRDAEPGGTILISRVREAISIAAGETDHVLTVPSANVTHAPDEIATMGTVTWA